MLEDGLFVGRWQFAVSGDRGGIFYLFPAVGDFEVSGAYDRLGQGNEREPMPGRHPDFDGAERWQVRARVDVDGFQFPDLAAFGVNNVVATPLPDIGRLEHVGLPLRSIARY